MGKIYKIYEVRLDSRGGGVDGGVRGRRGNTQNLGHISGSYGGTF